MHRRLDYQSRLQYGRHTKQIVGAVLIVLGNPDSCLVFVPYFAGLDQVAQQRFADSTRGYAPARMVCHYYRLPETLAEHWHISYHVPGDRPASPGATLCSNGNPPGGLANPTCAFTVKPRWDLSTPI